MTLTAQPLDPGKTEEWNRLVERANGGTIFHRLDFLAYHGDRFKRNERHVLFRKGESILGVMPLAIFDRGGGLEARSPFGGSYGGPVFTKVLHHAESVRVADSLVDYLEELRADACRLVFPIECCYAKPSDTFRLALLERGFELTNRDVSSVVCLDGRLELAAEASSRASRLRRKAKKARDSGVTSSHRAPVRDFWRVLEKTFQRLDAEPTHTFDELSHLCRAFEERIYVDVAYLGDEPIGGIAFMQVNERVSVTFYLCSDLEHRSTQALTLLVWEAMERLRGRKTEWLDLGTSSASQQARPGLFRFKESFGAVGQFRDTYSWSRKER
jgi:hypothetical protein